VLANTKRATFAADARAEQVVRPRHVRRVQVGRIARNPGHEGTQMQHRVRVPHRVRHGRAILEVADDLPHAVVRAVQRPAVERRDGVAARAQQRDDAPSHATRRSGHQDVQAMAPIQRCAPDVIPETRNGSRTRNSTHHRDHRQRSGGHERRPLDAVLADERNEPGRDGPVRLVVDQRAREHEVRPRQDRQSRSRMRQAPAAPAAR
jgi:hypothetical protein